jgi:hypothetical protein
MSFSRYEQSVLDNRLSYGALVAILVAAAAELWLFTRRRAKLAVLYYEEVEPEAITTLGIGTWQATGREQSADRGNLLSVSKPVEESIPGNGS